MPSARGKVYCGRMLAEDVLAAAEDTAGRRVQPASLTDTTLVPGSIAGFPTPHVYFVANQNDWTEDVDARPADARSHRCHPSRSPG